MPWTWFVCRGLFVLVCLLITEGVRAGRATTLDFTIQPDSRVFVVENREFMVPCKAVGHPLPLKYWRNDSVLNSPVVVNVTADGLSFVGGVRLPRSLGTHRVGTLRCMASNTAGVAMSKKFELNVIYLRNISVRLTIPAVFGDVARLKCVVFSNQPLKYTWFKDNAPLSGNLNDRIAILPSGILQIRNYTIMDNGRYSCRAENDYEGITSRWLRITGKSMIGWNSSIHIYPGENIHITVGNAVVIECIQHGPHAYPVAWRKATDQGPRNLTSGSGASNLVFKSVKLSDAGKYHCLGANEDERTVSLSVGAPPSFKKRLPRITREEEGKTVVLTCHANVDSTMSVKWYKNGGEILEEGRVRFARKHSEYGLVVSNLLVKDSGVYQCEIENKYGSSVDHTILLVKEKDEAPYDVRADVLSSTAVNVTWKVPAGHKKSLFFSVHCWDFMRHIEHQAITQDHAKHFLLTYLKPYTIYLIYVKVYVYNKSVIERSNSVQIRTLEAKPVGPPVEIRLKSYSYGTLDITWLPPPFEKRRGDIVGYEVKYAIEHESRSYNHTVTKNFYSVTLRNLLEGEAYDVKIAARTSKGLGPYSKWHSVDISRASDQNVIPAPDVITKVNVSCIIVSVARPPTGDVRGYCLTYKNLMDDGKLEQLLVNQTAFRHPFHNLQLNSEYVFYVKAYGPGTSVGKPAVVVVPTANETPELNKTARDTNETALPPMEIKCHHARNSTALVVQWVNLRLKLFAAEYEVKYFMLRGLRRPRVERTKFFNVTITGLTPGSEYHVEVRTIFLHRPRSFYSPPGIPKSGKCVLPEIKPGTPPRNVSCMISASEVTVTWRPPTEPNGKLRRFWVEWRGADNEEKSKDYKIFKESDIYGFPLKSFRKHPNFTVAVYAENSAGRSPREQCVIDTTSVKDPTVTSVDPDRKNPGKNDDIERGIIIGCIISVLLLFILVVFVCWSGCRRRKPLPTKSSMNGLTGYQNLKSRSANHTVTTEISDASKHQILQKYVDEEASKESDRGLGMTPKSSRVCLNGENAPFLPKNDDPGTSADTSCDSQDSGIQGLGKKDKGISQSASGRNPEKTPLQRGDSQVETVL